MKRLIALLLACMLLMGCAAAAEDALSLNELATPYGFTIGGPLSYNNLRDPAYLSVMAQHFGSLTCTNETKAYSLLDQRASQCSQDGMPVMNFIAADQMIRFAQEYGIGVRGHVLVWDAYMPDWFFREGYMNNKPFVDRETMLARVESYITQVVVHFETEFPGVIYCWDVVNEAIGDSAAEWDASDARHIRTTRSGTSNLFRDVIGNDYVEYAFLYAHQAVQSTGADIKLFYNDYNAFMDGKRASICALAKSVNSFATDENGQPIQLMDGVGMQGYIGGYGTQNGCMNPADLASIKKSILTYADLGLEVQITEMSVRNYEDSPAAIAQHAAYYADLFRVFIEVNSGENKPLTNVSIWGAFNCDNLPASHYSWKLNSPYCGLFDLEYQPRPCFDEVVDVLLVGE